MPVHNGAKYLSEAIDSILGQSFHDFELIIVDDNSTDNTVDIISGYQDYRIQLHSSTKRLKLAGALNLGVEKAQGTYLARMDADDICEPNRLKEQYDFLEKNRHIGICGTSVALFPEPENYIEHYPLSPDEVSAFSLFHSPFAHPSVMIRKKVLTANHLNYNVDYYPTEDFDLWCRALSYTQGANLNKPLLRYRVHPESLTRADWSLMDEQAARITLRSLQSLNITQDIEQARYHRKVAMVRIECTPGELEQARNWLSKIRAANQQKHIYSPNALDTTLEDLWFRLCMHCAPTAWWSAKYFLSKRFGSYSFQTALRMLLLVGSFLKHRIKR